MAHDIIDDGAQAGGQPEHRVFRIAMNTDEVPVTVTRQR